MLRSISFLLILLLNYCSSATGKDSLKYPVQSIDNALLLNADAVIRSKETVVEFENNGTIILTEIIAITAFNANGADAADLLIDYDSFSEVSDIEGKIYDASGQLTRKIKNDEIIDFSIPSSGSLFTDNRIKNVNIHSNSYPFTTVFNYRKKITQYLTPPQWNVLHHSDISIEHASLKIIVSITDPILKYKEFNSGNCIISSDANHTTYSWNINLFKAIKYETDIPGLIKLFPSIIYSTGKYNLEKEIGKLNSWIEFGDFYFMLNKNADELNENAKNQIITITESIPDKKDKIKALYNWMQSQVRYVSIQQGIGGWKTFDANYVYKNKFGDCKALVNFMKSSLNVVGIKSYPILISAGSSPEYIYKDFVYNYFNHVILMIPDKSDTIWLECTSQFQPFDFLGDFTSDRDGLMIEEKNSKLIHTPSYHSDENISSVSAFIFPDPEQSSECRIHYRCTGELHSEIRAFENNASAKEKDDWIRSKISVSDFTLSSFNFLPTTKDSISASVSITLKSSSLVATSGTRIFIHPGILKEYIDDFNYSRERNYPLATGPEAAYIDSIIVKLPEGFAPESQNKNEKFSSELGDFEYHLQYQPENNSYILFYTFKARKTIIAPRDYLNCLEFRNKVVELKNKVIVCRKQ